MRHLSVVILAVGAACAAAPSGGLEPALHARGVRGLVVVRDAPGELVVALALADGGGRLTARVAGGEVVQRLDEPGGAWRLQSAGAAVRFERVAPGATTDAAAFARLVALDRALAVQGTSLVRGGYTPCTIRCDAAVACGAACPADVAQCAACLERAP